MLPTISAWADDAPRFERALPLNRFSASRQVQTDSDGFYRMPTAVEDDYFDATSPIERVKRHFAVARRVGAAYFRCGFTWNAIEREPGKYDWTFWDNLVRTAEQNHIPLIPYVAYPPKWAVASESEFWKQPPRDPQIYGDFMYTIAARYRGRVAAWEIWNEPDNHDYWTGTVDQFAPLVTFAAKRIREADPHAVLVLGGLSYGAGPFFQRLINDYHVDRYVDVIALHAYPETWSNERAETVFQQWIPAVWDALTRDQSGVDLWVNEMGYADYRYRSNQASIYGVSVYYRGEHTSQYQAQMLFKFEVMALGSGHVSLSGWYRIDDFPSTEKRLGPDAVNYHLGLFDPSGRPKPAFRALRFFNRLFSRPTRRVPARVGRPGSSQSVVDLFERVDGRFLMVGWLRSPLPAEVSDQSGMLEDRRSENISLDLPCARPKLEGYFDAEGRHVRSAARLVKHSLEGMTLRDGHVLIVEFRCPQ
ncbi:MAG TPA: cellulase family glycosylhydrolase [Bryobacteraceae bacterium]|nr:cellulase family glycosylhydrolase [Bryobacteraceae bacterium]